MTDSKLTYDDIVKNMLTNPINGKEYVAEIIGTILNINPGEILKNLEYIHPDIKENHNTVSSIADITLMTDKIYVDIEINRSKGNDTIIKNETYLYQLYLKELKTYKDYAKLKPVIQINIDCYDFFGDNRIISCSKLMDIETHKVTSEKIVVYHVNLNKLKKMNYKEISADRLCTILYLLTSSDQKILKKLYKGDELMESVKEEAERFAKEIDWAELYFDEDEIYRKNVKAEAREEAIKEVTEEITKKVTNEVTKEHAQNMLKANESDETIIKYLNITQEELDKIKEEM